MIRTKTTTRGRERLFFALSFMAAFVVFSAFWLLLMGTLKSVVPGSAVQSQVPLPVPAPPNPQDCLTLLCLFTEPKEDQLQMAVLIRFDPVGRALPLAALPAQTAVDKGGRREILAEAYRYGGSAYAKNQLSAALGLPIDRYLRIDTDNALRAMGLLGTVEFTLEQPVTAKRQDIRLTLEKGLQLLDGPKMAAILGQESYPRGELDRCRMAGELGEALLNSNRDFAARPGADQEFSELVNLCYTDLSFADYQSRKKAAQTLAESKTLPAAALEAAGSWDGELFLPADTFLAALAEAFA